MRRCLRRSVPALGLFLLAVPGLRAQDVSLAIGELPPGKTITVTFQATVDAPVAAGVEVVANQGVVSGNFTSVLTDDPDVGGVADPTQTLIAAAPDLQIVKTDGGISTIPGGNVVYTLTYGNAGNQNAGAVTITDTVPTSSTFDQAGSSVGWSCSDGDPGGTVCTYDAGALGAATSGLTVDFAVDVDNPFPPGQTELDNTATIADVLGEDANPGDNTANDTTPVITDADFGDAPDPSYPTLLANNGARHALPPGGAVLLLGAALDVETDGQPDSTATGDDLDLNGDDEDGVAFTSELVQGQSATIDVTVALNAGKLDAWVDFDQDGAWGAGEQIFTSQAVAVGVNNLSFAVPGGATLGATFARFRLSSAGGLAVTGVAFDGEVEDYQTPAVLPPPGLALTKSDGGVTVGTGDPIVYTLAFSNAGGSGTALGVLMSDTVPAHTTFDETLSGGPGIWSCADGSPPGTVCTQSLPDLAGGAGGSVSFAVVVDAPLPSGVDQIDNSATLSSSNGGTAGGSDSTPVDAAPDLTVSKDDGGTVPGPGDSIDYTISYQNVGSQDAEGVVLTETVPDHTTAGANPGWTVAGGGGPCAGAAAGTDCELDVGAVAAGAPSANAPFEAILDSQVGVPQIVNLVEVADDGANGADENPGDNSFQLETALETVPPQVTLVGSVPDTGDGELEECEATPFEVAQLLVTFDEEMFDPAGDGDPGDVTNPANYELIGAGADNDIESTVCGVLSGDDVLLGPASVSYDAPSSVATLTIGAATPDDPYRLLVCPTLIDQAGNPLDGDGNGTGGEEFVRTFRVDSENELDNGHLDCSLDDWVLVSTNPAEIEHSSEDVDDASVSGSARIMNLSAGTDFTMGQCQRLQAQTIYQVAVRARVDQAAPDLRLQRICQYYSDMDCTGPSFPLEAAIDPLVDTGGAWVGFTSEIVTPAGADSALCTFTVHTAAGDGFDLFLDDLSVTFVDILTIPIFADGFESGDTSAWTTTVE